MQTFDTNQLFYIMPEIIMLSGISLILILNLFLNQKNQILGYYLSQFLLIITLISTFGLLDTDIYIFNNSFVVDKVATYSKIFILIFSIVLLQYSKHYLLLKNLYKNEYFSLALLSILGMMIMSSGSNMITLYLGLEIMSLALYSLIAMANTKILAIEAALKYFVLGAIASGILLYGMSLIYGTTGSLDITTIAYNLKNANMLIVNFASVFILIGIAFKFGAVPFHMWMPDAYQGANVNTTMFLSSVPKIATLLLFVRLLVEAMEYTNAYWSQLAMFLGLVSIIVGALVALNQTNIKRLLAYSTISHIGFILVALSLGTQNGFGSAFYYTIVYVLTTILMFGILIAIGSKDKDIENIKDLQGLFTTKPFFAILILVAMFSMAGIPPFVGFYAKLAILNEVIKGDYLIVAGVMVVFAVISAYYYLHIIKIMFFNKPKEIYLGHNCNFGINSLLVLNALTIFILGIFPESLIHLSYQLF